MVFILIKQKTKDLDVSTVRDRYHGKATKPYFSLEKRMRMTTNRVITCIQVGDKQLTDTKSILNHAARPFY